MFHIRHLVARIATALAIVLLFVLVSPYQLASQAASQGIVVNTLDDEDNADGDCSLREALRAAADNVPVDGCLSGSPAEMDTITFSVVGTILLSAQLDVNPYGSLLIDGGGAITLDGNHKVRVLYINNPGDQTLKNLTITGGASTDYGGGIYNNIARLVILNSTISGCTAFGLGGYGGGGGIYSQDDLTISNSTLSGKTSDSGGGVYVEKNSLTVTLSTFISNNAGWAGGGAIYNKNGGVNITDSSFINNHTSDSQGFQGRGGAIFNGENWQVGAVTVSSSTFSGNSAIEGGALSNTANMTLTDNDLSGNSAIYGGGIHNSGWLTVTGSTLSSNNADWAGGGIQNANRLILANSTLSANHTDGYGGGIDNGYIMTITTSSLNGNSSYFNGGGIYNSFTTTLSSTLIIGTSSGGNCDGLPVIDGGYNLEDTDICGFDPAKGSLPNTDPLLGPLQNNGGPTFTHALLPGSPAIDAGDPAACPPQDQRGMMRPLDGDGDGLAVCDLGAFEVFDPRSSAYQVFLPVSFR